MGPTRVGVLQDLAEATEIGEQEHEKDHRDGTIEYRPTE
jgi:hypothetical protein